MYHHNHDLHFIIKLAVILNLGVLIRGALLPSNPGSIPLTSCNRRCLDTFTDCLSFYDASSHQCRLLEACTRTCYRENIGGSHRSTNSFNDDYDNSDSDDVRSMLTSFQNTRKKVDGLGTSYRSINTFSSNNDNNDIVDNTFSEKSREQGKRKEILRNRMTLFTKREVIVKRACLGECDAERYMCSEISDSVMGIYLCNRSNNMCRKKCGW